MYIWPMSRHLIRVLLRSASPLALGMTATQPKTDFQSISRPETARQAVRCRAGSTVGSASSRQELGIDQPRRRRPILPITAPRLSGSRPRSRQAAPISKASRHWARSTLQASRIP